MPTPSSANPAMPCAGTRAVTTRTPPRTASRPPARTVLTGPKRWTTASPASLAAAMVQANAVKLAAPIASEAPVMSWRYTPDQSMLAPSARIAHMPTAPISSAERGGRAKRGGGSSSGSGRTSSRPRQTRGTAAVRPRPTRSRCTRASRPRDTAPTPTAEPMSAPALHRPCSPDMIDRPWRRSTSTPCAFMATSAMPEVAP